MHELYELKEQLMEELKEYRGKQKKSMDDITVIKYLTSSIDHLCNIIMAAEEEEYSSRGSYNMGGGSRYSRDGYSREGGNRGGYSREGGSYENRYAYAGRNTRRDSMGRYSRNGGYSRADGVENLVDEIRGAMSELPQNLQQEAQKFIQKIESM